MQRAPSQTPNRTSLRVLHLALVAGICAVSASFAVVFLLGTAPLLPGDHAPAVSGVLGAAALGIVLLGWLWARPRVPRRDPRISIEAYWADPEPGGRAFLVWILWEGGAIIGAVGTLLTGSFVTLIAGLLGLILLVVHSPGYLERR